MVFVLGSASSGRLGYDYFGDWFRVIDLYVSSPEIVSFCPDLPGEAEPGCVEPGGRYIEGRLEVGVE